MSLKYKLLKSKEYEALLRQISSLRREAEIATQFIKQLSENQLDSHFTTENAQSDLLKELRHLNEKWKLIGEEEQQRAWVSEGLALFGDILRNQEAELDKFGDLFLSKLVQYIEANQGSLFLLSEKEGQNVLVQMACYAYNRKKFGNKIIQIGEGLVGQTFLEQETTLLTEVPPGYISITSGLGDAPPRCVVLVPIKANEKMLGVLELASFKIFPKHVVLFLEKIGEALGAAVANVKIATKTQQLLLETQLQAEQMRAQEEEMRQNLEELQATQEEMIRKQTQLDQKSQLIQLILDNIPVPTFVKDEEGRYTLANKAEIELLGISEEAIIGKDDSFFTQDKKEIDEIRRSDNEALQAEKPIELPMQTFTTANGKQYSFKTTKVSFWNNVTGKRNIIGVSIDLTDRIKLEKELDAGKKVAQNSLFIDLAGRQRMLSQKIGFYAEAIMRGQVQHLNVLRKAIDLYQHSMLTLREGGWPQEIDSNAPVQPAPKELIPYMGTIHVAWDSFRKAAETIITLHDANTAADLQEKTEAILLIEEQGEVLLQLNNKLLVEYKMSSQINAKTK